MQFSYWNSEPIELRVLKQQLSNLKCKCLNCKKYNIQCKKNIQNAGVQTNQRHGSVDRFSQGTSDQKIEKPINVDKACSNKLIPGGEICPSCRIIVEFLHENQKKVLKDEESETNPVTCCDKATSQSIEYLEKSTSITRQCKPTCNMLKTISNELDDAKDKKRNHDRVSFEDTDKNDLGKAKLGLSEEIYDGGLEKAKSYVSCICLEKFMNAIRQPVIQ